MVTENVFLIYNTMTMKLHNTQKHILLISELYFILTILWAIGETQDILLVIKNHRI